MKRHTFSLDVMTTKFAHSERMNENDKTLPLLAGSYKLLFTNSETFPSPCSLKGELLRSYKTQKLIASASSEVRAWKIYFWCCFEFRFPGPTWEVERALYMSAMMTELRATRLEYHKAADILIKEKSTAWWDCDCCDNMSCCFARIPSSTRHLTMRVNKLY